MMASSRDDLTLVGAHQKAAQQQAGERRKSNSTVHLVVRFFALQYWLAEQLFFPRRLL
jgi:hypothetical protein